MEPVVLRKSVNAIVAYCRRCPQALVRPASVENTGGMTCFASFLVRSTNKKSSTIKCMGACLFMYAQCFSNFYFVPLQKMEIWRRCGRVLCRGRDNGDVQTLRSHPTHGDYRTGRHGLSCPSPWDVFIHVFPKNEWIHWSQEHLHAWECVCIYIYIYIYFYCMHIYVYKYMHVCACARNVYIYTHICI